MTEKLKPCPFCGMTEHLKMEKKYHGYRIECENCGANGGTWPYEMDAEVSWNTRHCDHIPDLTKMVSKEPTDWDHHFKEKQ